ncbi:cobalamin-dependent protein [Rhodovibrionaceae bacterium A322]
MSGSASQHLHRAQVFPEQDLPKGKEILAEGRALGRDWTLGSCAFLAERGVASEAEFKRSVMSAPPENRRVMQHAQVGFRDPAHSLRAYREIYSRCQEQGVTVDRYGLCLDWSMGYRRDDRKGRPKGTGLILTEPEQFARLTAQAPVAPHFGDFVLGFPAALENTQAALAAGASTIGNLGQYFTFRLPDWHDEVDTTSATLKALGLIAAQPEEILVHSNLDDGFAALFTDLSSALGAVMLERYLVEDLIGAKVSHCYGHHFSEPLTRMAFQLALAEVNPTPGSMVYGNTTSFRGTPAANYGALGNYLLVDALAQQLQPSGHGINAVPVTENQRIPDLEEIIEAQLFAGRLIELAPGFEPLLDVSEARAIAAKLRKGAQSFYDRALAGFQQAGIDIEDPFEMLLALRRLGSRRLEALFGAGEEDSQAPGGRRALVEAATVRELEEEASHWLDKLSEADQVRIRQAELSVVTATSDVHEHGKLLLERMLVRLGVTVVNGGVSVDPKDLALETARQGADLIALSTYNGVALSFVTALKSELQARDLTLPLLVGGRLNQIPDTSNSSLPVEVGADLAELGALPCTEASDIFPQLLALADQKLAG